MEDPNNKKMMEIINRRRMLTRQYLEKTGNTQVASVRKPATERSGACNAKALASDEMEECRASSSKSKTSHPQDSVEERMSNSSKSRLCQSRDFAEEEEEEEALNLSHTKPNPSESKTLTSSLKSCQSSYVSNPDAVLQLEPRWWQREQTLRRDVENQTYSLPPATINSQNGRPRPGGFPASPPSTKSYESMDIWETIEANEDQMRSYAATAGRRLSDEEEFPKKRNAPHRPPPSAPKPEDGRLSMKSPSKTSHQFDDNQGLHIVPPPRRRVALSEYYVGEVVLVRTSRYVWLPAHIQGMAPTGLRVRQRDSALVLNIPREILYTHLRKLDEDLEHMSALTASIREAQVENPRRAYLQDEEPADDRKAPHTCPAGWVPVHLVRPAHLAHRRLYRRADVLSCMICYEGMSEMDAHFPWKCNHGCHFHCLELKSQTSVSGFLANDCCPPCMESISRQRKQQKLLESDQIDVKPSILKEEPFPLRDVPNRGAQTSRNMDRRHFPPSELTPDLFSTDGQPPRPQLEDMKKRLSSDFKAFEWIAVQCDCGFVGIVRKSGSLGSPAVCRACLNPVFMFWTPFEEDLVRALAGELPSISSNDSTSAFGTTSKSPQDLPSPPEPDSEAAEHLHQKDSSDDSLKDAQPRHTPRRHFSEPVKQSLQKEVKPETPKRFLPPISPKTPAKVQTKLSKPKEFINARRHLMSIDCGDSSSVEINPKQTLTPKKAEKSSQLEYSGNDAPLDPYYQVTDKVDEKSLQVAKTSTPKNSHERSDTDKDFHDRLFEAPVSFFGASAGAASERDSSYVCVRPLHVGHQREDFGLEVSSSVTNASMHSNPSLDGQSAGGMDANKFAGSSAEVGSRQSQSSKPDINTPPRSPTMRVHQRVHQPSAAPGHALPADSLPFYITQKQMKQKLEDMNTMSGMSQTTIPFDLSSPFPTIEERDTEGPSDILEDEIESPLEDICEEPSELTCGTNMTRSTSRDLPDFDSLSSPADEQEQGQNPNSAPEFGIHLSLDAVGKLSIGSKISQAQERPSAMRHYSQTTPYFHGRGKFEPKGLGLRIPGSGLPTDSLSFYITPVQIKQQLAEFEKLEENEFEEEGKELEALEEEELEERTLTEDHSLAGPSFSADVAAAGNDGERTEEEREWSSPSVSKPGQLHVIPEDEAISSESSDMSSPSEPTSLASRLQKLMARMSKSAPSTPRTAPAYGPLKATSSSAPSTPPKGVSTHINENPLVVTNGMSTTPQNFNNLCPNDSLITVHQT